MLMMHSLIESVHVRGREKRVVQASVAHLDGANGREILGTDSLTSFPDDLTQSHSTWDRIIASNASTLSNLCKVMIIRLSLAEFLFVSPGDERFLLIFFTFRATSWTIETLPVPKSRRKTDSRRKIVLQIPLMKNSWSPAPLSPPLPIIIKIWWLRAMIQSTNMAECCWWWLSERASHTQTSHLCWWTN